MTPRWVSYEKRHGWMWAGEVGADRLVVAGDAWATRAVRLTAHAEGGRADMVQCYDAGVMSAGPLQATARFGLLQRLLARIQAVDFRRFEAVMGDVMYGRSAVAVWGSTPAWDARGAFAFFSLSDPTTPLKSRDELEQILLGGSDGTAWLQDQAAWARHWVESLAMLLRQDWVIPVVAEECAFALGRFVSPEAEAILGRVEPEPGVLRAVHASFAVNHPAAAMRVLAEAAKEAGEGAGPEAVVRSVLAIAGAPRELGNPCRVPSTFLDRAAVVGRQLGPIFGAWAGQ